MSENLIKFIENEVKRLHKQTILLESDVDEEQFDEPDYENDCFIQDNIRSGYDVSCAGKYIDNAEEIDTALLIINNWMKEHKFYPTIWFVSDHGNVWPIDKDGNEIKESKDVKAMYRKSGMKPPRGKGIHTKKFHKCVTSVGDDKGKNPYAICMSTLGRDKSVKSSHRTNESIDDSEDDDSFELDITMVIYSHLSDVQEISSKETRKRINFVKMLVDELAKGVKTISEKKLNSMWATLNESVINESKSKTRQDYIRYLNELQPDYESDEWIIGGKNRAKQYYGNYGEAIRKFDPIAFNVGYNEWSKL